MLLVHQICSRVFAYYIMNEWIIFTATCHATPSTVSTLARLELPNGHYPSITLVFAWSVLKFRSLLCSIP